ncbi:pentatricopeptide repeat-containing protein At1g02060, chloroplastic-like [Zingiber officinale]|uniref:Pentatricopeptide repeat-containing protein n=1 Tax=Zingiber officinale TaxID=94328 RepID=A0A8J5IMP4_ZINOF|nr:pentatricopeptide repeat-containing protein At1g02060, chloroplastic-like [Zingiber officinale]KAG6537964.1 hypothetical protein ZIOFF_003067 [Zingiber officinale]
MLRLRTTFSHTRLPSASRLCSSAGGLEYSELGHAIADLVNAEATDSWPPSLPASLTALVRSHTHTLSPSDLLHSLYLLRRPNAAGHLLLWSLNLVPLEPAVTGKAIYLLLRSRSIHPALDLLLSLPPSSIPDNSFNALLRRLATAGHLRYAVRLFRLIPSPSVFSYNSLLAAFFRRGRTRAASDLFEEMLARAVRPDVCTFNTLIRGFCLNSMVHEAFHVFKEMSRHGCAPDVVTYNTLLDGLCRAGEVRIAHKLLNGMRRNTPDTAPNVVSYTTLIRGYCSKLLAADALNLFNDMISVGLQPNNITYNTLIQGLCKSRRMDLVKELLDRGKNGDEDLVFEPDTCTFNTLIAAHCNMGCFSDALKVFEKMTEMQVDLDSVTYGILIRGLCENGEFGRAEELIDELLKKEVLRRRGRCVPLVATYNPMLNYLCHSGKTEKARIVLQQLLDNKAKFDLEAFKTVILGYCKEGKLKKGYELLVSMSKRDLVPDAEIYQILINGFLQQNIDFAWEVLRKMFNSKHRPSTDAFHLVLMGMVKKSKYTKESGDLVIVMLERSVRPNIDLSTKVVENLFRSDSNDRAFKIVKLLYEKGYRLKMEELVVSLCKSRKFLEAREMLLFSLEKSEKISNDVYATVINKLCSKGKALEAFDLFYEIKERGCASINSSCLCALKVALENGEKMNEAKFVAKQINRAVDEVAN